MNGYKDEIDSLQVRQFPRRAIHEKIGIRSYHAIVELHFGQSDRGIEKLTV